VGYKAYGSSIDYAYDKLLVDAALAFEIYDELLNSEGSTKISSSYKRIK